MYTEVLTDSKIGKVCQMTAQPLATVLGVWVALLCRANDSPERGTLLIAANYPVTIEDLAMQCGIDIDTVEAILEKFKSLCMIVQEAGVYHVTNWDKRQFSSDVSTPRVRKHRAGEVDESGAPLPKRYSNAAEADQSRSETEQSGAARASSLTASEKCPKEWMTALYNLCAIDVATASPGYRRRISQCGITLIKSNVQPADLDRFRSWWFANDWRGIKGDAPTPEQIRDCWGKMNGKTQPVTQNLPTTVYR